MPEVQSSPPAKPIAPPANTETIRYAAFIGWLHVRHIAPALTSGGEHDGHVMATLIGDALASDPG